MLATVSVTPCGSDCLHLQTPGTVEFDLHRQGDTWTGSYTMNDGVVCAVSVDNASLAETDTCGANAITWQLAKLG